MMTFYDRGTILPGLIIGLCLFLSPFIYNAGTAGKAPVPELSPKAKEAKQCIAPKPYMTAWHMQLLDNWRHEVVRGGTRYFNANEDLWWNGQFDSQMLEKWRRFVTSSDVPTPGAAGKTYYKSLQVTCMECHSNKSKFCDECHNYLGVSPYCWDCHVQPKEDK
jgi:hypothetical protein